MPALETPGLALLAALARCAVVAALWFTAELAFAQSGPEETFAPAAPASSGS